MTTKVFSKIRVLILVSALVVAGMTGTTHAGMIEGINMNAQTIVDAFNGLNNGQGSSFKLGLDWDTNYFYNGSAVKGYEFADTSAYSSSKGLNTIFSMCVEPQVGSIFTIHNAFATLNYADGKSTTSNAHNVLSLGSAYLYTLFATTDMKSSYELGAAIRFLMGDLDGHDNFYVGWGDQYQYFPNQYLTDLWKMNSDLDYWTSAYNPDAYYEEIGNYSVFTMDLTVNGTSYQNFLYIANADPSGPSATPEPATMLILGLSAMALMPVVKRYRRSKS